MKSLFNGCSRSDISVIPANWNTKKASISSEWRIFYRFYDPTFKGTSKWGKLIVVKGMNKYKTLLERQSSTRSFLAQETTMLDIQGLNPITGEYNAPAGMVTDQEISSDMNFIQALREGMKKMTVSTHTLVDVSCCVDGVEKACKKLWDSVNNRNYSDLPVTLISRRHIKYILEQCGKDNKRWSNHRYNRYKENLSMIFYALKEYEVVEFNPTKDISKKQHVPAIREILTADEFKTIESKLKLEFYNFWRYMMIFFKSGSRTTELLSLRKGSDIMLDKQEFAVIVKKGKRHKRDIRIIHDMVLPLWQEIWDLAGLGDYLFSRGLVPGADMIRKDQVCRRWNRHVKADVDKGGLGIKKDFYSLKHLNTDQVAEALDINHAQLGDGHTTPVITLNNYAVGEKQRQRDRLKKVPTKFS